MDETRANWWMDDASRWHEGVPPPGWWKAEDGRWHRPDDRGGRLPPDDDVPTVEMQTDEFAGPAHFAGGTEVSELDDEPARPPWLRLAVLVSVVLLTAVAIAVAAITDGGGDDDRATITDQTTTTASPDTSPSSTPGAAPPAAAGSAGTATTEVDDPSASDRPPTTTVPPRAPTTVAPAMPPTPVPTTAPPAGTDVRQGGACAPEGATAVTSDGVPMTCTREKCRGAPFDSARWRRTTC
jgi:hypothetical protein